MGTAVVGVDGKPLVGVDALGTSAGTGDAGPAVG